MASDTQTAEKEAEAIELGGRYEIFPSHPLTHLDNAAGQAFAARGIKERRVEPFVLICTASAMSRMETIQLMRSVETLGLMRMLDAGVIRWPDGSRRLALVFEKPAGKRLMSALQDVIDPMPEEVLTRLVIQPAHSALVELSGRGITHGGIRPTNMFYRDITSSGLMIGECISSPCGYNQPLLFETIERGMALPAGRGLGTVSDDLYALGVTILMLLLGRNPVKHLDDDTLMQMKIERGTYPALVGQMRLSFTITEPLRGFLTDDPKQRWTLTDLDLWLNGRRLSPKQPQVPKRAVRPFEFHGEEYLYCRTLSRAFGRFPQQAAIAIDSGDLDRWLRRSMSDEIRANSVTGAIETASAAGKTANLADRLVARVSMALDPPAPIRYKTKSVMPDGIGPALQEAFIKGENYQPLAEIISGQLPMFWVNVQNDFKPEFVPLVHTFDMMRGYIEAATPGYGIERVLYELNQGMPCISPIVYDQFPLNPPDMIAALDVAARKADRPREPIDRHVAAFFAARNRRFDEVFLAQITPGIEPIRRCLAMLNILSETQRKYNGEPAPYLADWLVVILKPAIDRFRNRPLQEKMRKQLDQACKDGRLVELARIVDDIDQIRQDQDGFAMAKREYQAIIKELRQIEGHIGDREEMAETLGRQFAAYIAAGVGTVLAAGIILYYWVM
ncbi:MAG TPA: serine/threonine protein kinase [Azospirillaceae bacterium]|nr:serine/threonine protein kinase [Azospirillaceae bacterium]